ncbi:MAG: heme NO-binding domain-containing protein [Candidatus Kariarchaeaceae archaeon]|jgi:hypothetical protein
MVQTLSIENRYFDTLITQFYYYVVNVHGQDIWDQIMTKTILDTEMDSYVERYGRASLGALFEMASNLLQISERDIMAEFSDLVFENSVTIQAIL